MSISFNVLKDRIDYTLQNKTKEQIVINWLQSAFIGPDGISKSLFINTKLLKSLVLSTNAYIPPLGTVTDAFIPAENVEIQLFGFRVKDLFSKNKEKTITYRVFLSLFINSKPVSYYFDFEGKKK